MNNTSLVSHKIHNAQLIKIAVAAHVLSSFSGRFGWESVERKLYNQSRGEVRSVMVQSNPR